MLRQRPRRPRRRSERGQALILVLAFIAFFGLTVGAVLSVSDVAAVQHGITERADTTNLSPEGGAAFGAAEAGRSDVTLTCVPGNSGKLTMKNGDSATYSVNSCNPSGSASTGGGGQNCLLCLLNQTPVPQVFTSNQGVTTTGGNDFINGNIASGSPLTALPAGAHIYVYNQASSSGCVCSPAPPLTYAPPILDPFRSGGPAPLGAPSPVAGMPSGCPGGTLTANSGGCDANYAGNTTVTINPGVWHSLTVSGNAKVTLNPGVYVFSGPLTYSGSPKNMIDGTSGVTLYLACASYGSAGNPCPSTGAARTGGNIQISGNGNASFTAPSSGQYRSPPVVLLSDPNLLDPGSASSCYNGGGGCLINLSGNGASISGTIDLRLGGAEFHGNGAGTISAGRFIANSLFIGGSGGSGLNLTGPGTITTSNCGIYVDDVSASTGSGTGRAVIQSQCGAPKGIIDFNYVP